MSTASQAVSAAERTAAEHKAEATAAKAAAAATDQRLHALERDFIRARDEAAQLALEMSGAAPSSALAAARAEVERLENRIQGMVPKMQLDAGPFSLLLLVIDEKHLTACFRRL